MRRDSGPHADYSLSFAVSSPRCLFRPAHPAEMRCRREIKPSEVGGFRFLSANAGDRGSGAKLAPAVPSRTTQLLLQCSPGHADTPASPGLGFVSRRILQPIDQAGSANADSYGDRYRSSDLTDFF